METTALDRAASRYTFQYYKRNITLCIKYAQCCLSFYAFLCDKVFKVNPPFIDQPTFPPPPMDQLVCVILIPRIC